MTGPRDRTRPQRTLVLSVLASTLVPIIMVAAPTTVVMWRRDYEPRNPDAVVVPARWAKTAPTSASTCTAATAPRRRSRPEARRQRQLPHQV